MIRTYNSQNRFLLFFIFSIVCYSIPILFSFLFQGGFLSAWKQLLWIVASIICYSQINLFDKYYKEFVNHISLSFCLLVMFGVFALLLDLNVERVLFGIWVYLAGFPFIAFPYLVFRINKFLIFRKLIIFLSIFISMGLIIDHFYGIFSILNVSGGNEFAEAKGEENRATFLFESPTALVNFLNLLLLFVFIFFINASGYFKRVFFFLLILSILLAAYYTGSRQVLVASFFISFIGFTSYIKQMKSLFNKIFSFIGLFIICVGVVSIYNIMESDSLIANRVSDTDFNNDVRSKLWLDGLVQFDPDNSLHWFVGNGLSTTMGQKALPNEEVHHHYESAFLATFYELGIIVWFILLFPVVKLVKILFQKKKSYVKNLFLAYISTFIFIFLVAPGGMHFTSLMSVFIVGGFVYNYENLLNTLKFK